MKAAKLWREVGLETRTVVTFDPGLAQRPTLPPANTLVPVILIRRRMK
jgi:hypothetical protein